MTCKPLDFTAVAVADTNTGSDLNQAAQTAVAAAGMLGGQSDAEAHILLQDAGSELEGRQDMDVVVDGNVRQGNLPGM